MGVEPKIGVVKPNPPRMDGLFHGKKHYFLMDDLGVPLFFGNTHIGTVP